MLPLPSDSVSIHDVFQQIAKAEAKKAKAAAANAAKKARRQQRAAEADTNGTA